MAGLSYKLQKRSELLRNVPKRAKILHFEMECPEMPRNVPKRSETYQNAPKHTKTKNKKCYVLRVPPLI